jgi:chromosome partitioning protein
MQTIVLATQKGGSGKSTLAISLALAAMEAGHTARLIETDPQGTLSSWQRRRADPAPMVEVVYNPLDLEPRLQALQRSGISVTIIDTAGGVSAATTAAIRYSDFCLIPVRPSIVDIEATVPTLELARIWRKPFGFVLNQTPIRGHRISNAATALGDEAALDIPEILAKPFIVMRNDHQDALNAGLGVSELAPLGKSAEEMRNLWHWIESRLYGDVVLEEQPILSELEVSPSFVPAMYLRTPAKVDAAAS